MDTNYSPGFNPRENPVYDPRFVNLAQTPPPSTGGFFNDPNFQALLAGIGTNLDPEGPGGAIGKATSQYIRSKAAQKATETADQRRTEQISMLVNKLGGFSSDKVEGVSAAKVGPDGKITITYDPPGTVKSDLSRLNPEGTSEVRTLQMAGPTPGTTASSGATTAVTSPSNGIVPDATTAETINRRPRNVPLSSVIPFY